MKLRIVLLCMILLLLIGCDDTQDNTLPDQPKLPEQKTINLDPNKDYVQFTLNVHDWVFPDRSIEATERTIEIHEKYNVPVDIYLDDPTIQNYMENAPELINKLKTSSVVTISYHLRPPNPIYAGFDFIGLQQMTEQDRYNKITEYMTYELDLESGGTTENQGSFQYIKDTFGYAPVCVGVPSQGQKISSTLRQVYYDLGATFSVVHGMDTELGDKQGDLYIRPEQVEIKYYESIMKYINNLITPEQLILKELNEFGKPSAFVNIKMHENNYYTVGTPWGPVVWENNDRDKPMDPPFDLSLGQEVELRDDDYVESMFEFYEGAVKYVSEHPELYIAIDCNDLKEMIS